MQRIVLASRPQGAPVPENFRLETVPVPTLGEGEVLVRTLWLSLDPYMRGRISDAKSYAASVQIGEPITAECVGEVVESRAPRFRLGDLVRGFGNWQSHFVLKGEQLHPVDPAKAPPSTALGVLGMPGHTAYAGLIGIGKPKRGETVVIGAATGAVGSAAGQIAKILGCRVVGIAGGAVKCRYALDELGFDVCIDRREPGLADKITAACPDGVDIYIELVGGAVFDAVFPLLNTHARMPVIGTIAGYNAQGLPDGPDRAPWMLRQILVKRLILQGLIVWDWEHLRADFERDVAGWIASGQLKYREDVVEGLQNAPQAFIGLLEGRNFGKLVVKVAD